MGTWVWKESVRKGEETRSMYCKVLDGRPSLCVNISCACSALLPASITAND